jgi:UDP-N-acetylglucosamine 2-epimerase (non-hydrolysing)
VLLAHCEGALANLRVEGITSGVHLVGNTMIDSLLEHLEPAREGRPWERLGVEPQAYALVTLHRPALVDEPESLAATVEGLVTLAEAMPVVFPVHPRTQARLGQNGLADRLVRSGVIVTRPLDYLAFLGLEAEARLVLTDSGGVQEETSALGVPCFTLRSTTERPVTIELGTNVLLGARPERIGEIPRLLGEASPGGVIPLWDGRAGARAAQALLDFLG